MEQLLRQFHKEDGYFVHVRTESLEQIIPILGVNDFRMILISGEKIKDQNTFFVELSHALIFPDYFGKNWDAWDECLWDFEKNLKDEKVAIVWNHADKSVQHDLQSCIHGICDLSKTALRFMEMKNRTFEIFLLGNWISK